MLRPSDFVVVVLVVAAVVWLNVPGLLLPALFVALATLSVSRWRREGRDPLAAERYRWQLVASCVVLAAVSVPLALRVVPPNGVYGFRTSLTRSNADIWYSANAFMGWALLAAAAISAGALAFLSTAKRWLLLVTFLLPLFCAVVASFAYLERIA